jgi:hypothetical protein
MAIASPSARQTVSEPPTPGDRHDHGDPNKIGLINRDLKRAPSANCPSSRHKRPARTRCPRPPTVPTPPRQASFANTGPSERRLPRSPAHREPKFEVRTEPVAGRGLRRGVALTGVAREHRRSVEALREAERPCDERLYPGGIGMARAARAVGRTYASAATRAARTRPGRGDRRRSTRSSSRG